jgi:regulator of extracellular matrix RemA (YlzA/DUF370 family)
VKFAHSKGEAVEAMRGNQTMPVILRVDASKVSLRQQPETHQNRLGLLSHTSSIMAF